MFEGKKIGRKKTLEVLKKQVGQYQVELNKIDEEINKLSEEINLIEKDKTDKEINGLLKYQKTSMQL